MCVSSIFRSYFINELSQVLTNIENTTYNLFVIYTKLLDKQKGCAYNLL